MTRAQQFLGFLLSAALWGGTSLAQDDLMSGFRTPPATARPHTWWHWMNGNITKEGITADLEAMRQIGLGGAQIFNVSEGIPDGPVPFMSPAWRELLQHAVREADRLGLELCLHNCAGWSSSGGPWIKPEQAMQIVVTSETRVRGPVQYTEVLPQPPAQHDFYRDIAVLALPTPQDDTQRIQDIKPKAGYEARYGQQPVLDEYPRAGVVLRGDIVDLSAKLAGDGRLVWDVPAGDWTILRCGYTPTGAQNAPAPASGRGLECDKLSRAGLDAHWAAALAPLIQELGPLAGRTLKNCLIDSYEVGPQNWTATFREEFRTRRGYDLLPFLPVLSGRVVDSGEVSERFLWDLRRTIADLFADNYYSYFSQLCHRHGLLASIEPYDGPFECLLAGKDADIPMGEFWVGGGESNSCKLAAAVAHTYGRKLVGAESFTADPAHGRWQNHPFTLKAIGDLMYCTGINRYIIHRYAHQPWPERAPGMTMGQWGTHFERTTTWWPVGGAWIQYLTRCQYLLQQGLFVADICYFAGEGAPGDAPHHPAIKAKGYDYDTCNSDVLLTRMAVRDGRLVLPDGMSYRVLVLPDTPFMTPQVLTKLVELVKQGATVIGPRPTRSPSLTEYPACDATVQRLADELWGDCDGKTVQEHKLGNGRVTWGVPPEEVLAARQVGPDCAFTGPTKRKMAWIHRRVGEADVYFVSSQSAGAIDITCTFRCAGRVPELWRPDTGEITAAPLWSEQDGGCTVPLHLDPAGSVFVVFRTAAGKTAHFATLHRPGELDTGPQAPRIEIRQARYEAVDGAGGVDVTAKVTELVRSGETSIPANNATFGDPIYMHVKRLRVEYTVDDKLLQASAVENTTLELLETSVAGAETLPPCQLVFTEEGQLELRSFEPGVYDLRTATGRTARVEVGAVPAPLEITGPWTVRFPPNWGAPPSIALDALCSWTAHGDSGVRYFSGTAEYEGGFELSADWLQGERSLYLELGQVQCLAEVSLNGRDLGVWWKPPFAGEIPSLVRPGHNTLKVRVTTLWINRLIGDELHPDDCEWDGIHLKRWPQWYLEGQPRPAAQRLTFTTWKHYTKDSPLRESGLLGPVRVRVAQRVPVE
jgi:hypothetical protein